MMPVYAGTFDPITRGHLSVIRRMRDMFGKGVVLVAVNPDKSPMFTPQERVKLINYALIEEGLNQNIGVSYTTDYVVDWAKHLFPDTILVRGLRKASETDYELQIADFNRKRREVETILVPAATGMQDVSSSYVRHLAESASYDELKNFVPGIIANALIERVQKPV